MTETWWLALCWRPVGVAGSERAAEDVERHERDLVGEARRPPAAASATPIAATPDTVCAVSVARPTSRWLSPPNGMWIATTGVTFIWISVTAAEICDAALLSVIDDSVSSRFWLMLRTCCCDVTSESMYARCAGVAPFL